MSRLFSNEQEIDSMLSVLGEKNGNKLLLKIETEYFSDKVMKIYSNGKINYLEKTKIEHIDLYKSKSSVGINLSHIEGSKYFRCFGLDHTLTQEAFEYLISVYDRKMPYFSKGIKKEIEEKFGDKNCL